MSNVVKVQMSEYMGECVCMCMNVYVCEAILIEQLQTCITLHAYGLVLDIIHILIHFVLRL